MDDEERRNGRPDGKEPGTGERLDRREALKRIARGTALVGTIGVVGLITQGQDECTGGYANFYHNFYYNYSDLYDNYYNAYYNFYNYFDYYNYYNHERHWRHDWDHRREENEEHEEHEERGHDSHHR
jgi:hypothetical protein